MEIPIGLSNFLLLGYCWNYIVETNGTDKNSYNIFSSLHVISYCQT